MLEKKKKNTVQAQTNISILHIYLVILKYAFKSNKSTSHAAAFFFFFFKLHIGKNKKTYSSLH